MPAALLLVDVQYDFLPPSGALGVPSGDDVLPVCHDLLDRGDWALVVASQDYHPSGHISFASTHSLPAFSSTRVADPRSGTDAKDKEQELWPDHCVQGTKGCEIEEGVRRRMDERSEKGTRCEVVRKGSDRDLDAYSSFASPLSHPSSSPSPLTQLLLDAHITTLVVVGLATDFCVRASVLDALSQPWARAPPRSSSEPSERDDEASAPPPGRVLVVREGTRGVDPERSERVLRELEAHGARVVGVDEALRVVAGQAGRGDGA
ncbi:hypothetical protein JCM9279_000895 [Rhodotorula babjevae]